MPGEICLFWNWRAFSLIVQASKKARKFQNKQISSVNYIVLTICSNIYTSNCKATDISARVCCYANRGRLSCSAIYKFWFSHGTRHNPILISLRIIGKNRWLVSRNWRDVKKRGRSTYVIGIIKKWWPRTSAPTWPFSLGTRHLKRTKNEDANSSFRLGTFFSFLKLFGFTELFFEHLHFLCDGELNSWHQKNKSLYCIF